MDGADIAAAVALGADYTLVGRAYMYGLMAGGQRGVARMLDIMEDQLRRTLRLCGVTRISDLTPDHVTAHTSEVASGYWI
jgi:L-lactate dehydrogenase (cytochrome)